MKDPTLGEMGITFIGGSGRAGDFRKRAVSQMPKEGAILLGGLHPSFSQSTNKTTKWAKLGIEYVGG